jgi:hypothetical protein
VARRVRALASAVNRASSSSPESAKRPRHTFSVKNGRLGSPARVPGRGRPASPPPLASPLQLPSAALRNKSAWAKAALSASRTLAASAVCRRSFKKLRGSGGYCSCFGEKGKTKALGLLLPRAWVGHFPSALRESF